MPLVACRRVETTSVHRCARVAAVGGRSGGHARSEPAGLSAQLADSGERAIRIPELISLILLMLMPCTLMDFQCEVHGRELEKPRWLRR
jgi:hypothetical protein